MCEKVMVMVFLYMLVIGVCVWFCAKSSGGCMVDNRDDVR